MRCARAISDLSPFSPATQICLTRTPPARSCTSSNRRAHHCRLIVTASITHSVVAKEEIWTCNGSSGQTWSFSGGTLTVDRGAYCLDVYGDQTSDGSRVTLWTCDGDQSQQWSW